MLWEKPKGFYDKDTGFSFAVIRAKGSIPLAYLTFEKSDNHPVIQGNVGDATKFDIKFPPPRAK